MLLISPTHFTTNILEQLIRCTYDQGDKAEGSFHLKGLSMIFEKGLRLLKFII